MIGVIYLTILDGDIAILSDTTQTPILLISELLLRVARSTKTLLVSRECLARQYLAVLYSTIIVDSLSFHIELEPMFALCTVGLN